MTTLSFHPLPEDFPYLPLSSNLGSLFKLDGPLSADDSLIEAATTLRYSSGAPNYEPRTSFLTVDITGSFTYGPLATVAGTVTEITVRLDDTDLVSLTDLSTEAGDAAAIWVALMGGKTPLAPALSGDDTLTGTDEYDILAGHAGNDVIRAFDGGSSLSGGAGHDRLFGGDGFDYIRGGAGRDRITAGNDGDTLYGGTGNDVIRGEAGRDYIDGESGKDLLFGGRGNDFIYGGRGNDALSGGAGNDQLSGQAGDDTLSGGLGEDVFEFHRFGVSGKTGSDTITDFETTDAIHLGRIDDGTEVNVTQVGDDVTIAVADPEIDSLITVLDATAAEVEAAISTSPWYYFY